MMRWIQIKPGIPWTTGTYRHAEMIDSVGTKWKHMETYGKPSCQDLHISQIGLSPKWTAHNGDSGALPR